jgi:hypothetical protein
MSTLKVKTFGITENIGPITEIYYAYNLLYIIELLYKRDVKL